MDLENTIEKKDQYGEIAVWFLRSAGALLLVTGIAKLFSGFGTAKILSLSDPIIGMSFGKLLPAVGVLEVLVAIACFSNRLSPRIKLWLVAWMATNFLVYRIGLWNLGWHRPCGCMGSLSGALHLSDYAADNILKNVLSLLLLGSYTLLFACGRSKFHHANIKSLKVSQ